MNNKFKTALSLFTSFFKIGLFTFGGGYAMIPLIQREMVEKHGWITDDDMLEIIAVAESTPGPIAINSATFVGYKTAGILGAFCATSAVVLPSFIIISILSFFIDKFKHLKAVSFAFNGIRAGVLALIVKALVNMAKKCPHNTISYIIVALAFSAVAIFGTNVFLVIVSCAVIGLVSSIMIQRRSKKL